MIIIKSQRQDVETVYRSFFPVINMYKQTRLLNTAGKDVMSEEYLSVIAINCLLSEVELLIQKKLLNTILPMIRVKFTDAQAIVLYKALLLIPIDSDKIFYMMLRNRWVEMLDGELIKRGIYKKVALPADVYSDSDGTDFD